MKKHVSRAIKDQPNGQMDLGQHMTPPTIAKQMAGFFTRPVCEWRVIDPACGDGNLLLAVIDCMEAHGITDISSRIAGIDIDPQMVKQARKRIAERLSIDPVGLQVLEYDFLASQESSLFETPILDFATFNSVISNPPYGKNREYAFFKLCNKRFTTGTELVFLMPLAFLDRTSTIKSLPLNGRPMGVTTGHAIVYHVAGEPFEYRSVKEHQTNTTPFQVLTGVKLYELGGGNPPQTKDVLENKPYSSTESKPGWIPCLRTGDVHPFRISLGRLFVDYGDHLGHPKDLARFQGPRLFIRRVPIWESKQLGAAYIEQTALCAGDVLVIRHHENDTEMLKALCVFLNSPEAAEHILNRRPSIRHRDSYPKFSAKDVNELLQNGLPSIEMLRGLARHYPEQTAATPKSLIETDFPVSPISASCSREKSTRHGHISTLQMWWARRPLAVCRSAIFASLVPSPGTLNENDAFIKTLHELIPGRESPTNKLIDFTARLAEWKSCENPNLLATANSLIMASRSETPKIADTFAGGGSFPLEALRLGLDSFGSDLNPVAVTALKASLELLPKTSPKLLIAFRKASQEVLKRFRAYSSSLYGHTNDKTILAFFWCRTYTCPECKIEVPLLNNRVLSAGDHQVIVTMEADKAKKRFHFAVCEAPSPREFKAATLGTVGGKGAVCPNCSHRVPTSFLQTCSCDNKMGDRLYAKRAGLPGGRIQYEACTASDEALAASCELRSVRGRLQKAVPSQEFDINGIRHVWAIQYGIRTTADLFNRRQSVMLLEVMHELQKTLDAIGTLDLSSEEQKALSILLVLTLNRLVMYNSRHSWWQPNGEFPANIFVRQAIPMVWNYVEMPIDSPAAGGLTSAVKWLLLIAEHCQKLPRSGLAVMADAAKSELLTASQDLVTLDPPYYDSVVYAYLADVFYVWMKPLLERTFPELYATSVTVKTEEAIVDRPHKLAPAPKGDKHFRRKMFEAFKEAKRVLKPTGRLLLMFGHKKSKAWDAVMSSLFEAGFSPVASWPVHTERKAKLRHGRIAALSTSCLLVCTPNTTAPVGEVEWGVFQEEVRQALLPCIQSCKSNHLYGSDLLTSMIAPALAAFTRYRSVIDDDEQVGLELFLKRLPRLVADCEIEALLQDCSLKKHRESARWLRKLYEANGDGATFELKTESNDPLFQVATDFSEALLAGSQHEADKLWHELPDSERAALRVFFEALSLVSADSSNLKQRADTSLGRIGMKLRESNGSR